MPNVVINGVSVNTEDLNEEVVRQIDALKFMADEIERLEKEIRVYRIAFVAQRDEVKAEIQRLGLTPQGGEKPSGEAQ